MKKVDYFIKKYLENRPMFMAIIRSQEAMLFQKYQKHIKNKTLDFGCSEGFFAKLAFGKNEIDVGLDLFGNRRVEEAKNEKVYKNISLYEGDIIPYPNKHFKTVISNCVLEHIPNVELSLKEIYRVLKPGGIFLTSVMSDQWEKNQFGSKIFGKTYLNYMRKTQVHHNLFSNKQWQSSFKKAGFKIQSIDGYLYSKSSYWLDIAHYLSIFSLIRYKLFGRWVLIPTPLFNEIKTRLIKKTITEEKNPDNASAIFFVLKK